VIVSQGPLALVGSGEYLPVMAGVEGMLLAGRPPRYVQIPTAAAPEGEQSLRRWLDLGAAQAARLGAQPVPVVVRDRNEADEAELAALVKGAGLSYLSGGNPAFLAQALRGSRVWAAVVETWQSGAALAGCSAGAIALTGWVPGFRSRERDRDPGLPDPGLPDPGLPDPGLPDPGLPDPGLAVLPALRVLPHFDRMLGWAPELVAGATSGAAPSTTVIGVDEDTAIVDMTGSGHRWQVHGRQQAWVLTDGSRAGFPAGSWLTTS
jgi:cyanophycinase